MKCEKINFSDDKSIIIIDESVVASTKIDIYYGCSVSPYRINNTSCKEVQGIVDRRLKCDIENNHPIVEDLLREGTNSRKMIDEYIPNTIYGYTRGYINLGIHGDVNQIHTDSRRDISSKTLLYYANKHWEYNWGGHTIFFDDEGDIKITVQVKPGRIVIFDGGIPHTVMPMNPRCSPSYRFTVALKWESLKDSPNFNMDKR
tara:strand:- start:1828 stop:2433 length:606 start_codon:yes stop_codon:yes gene_type:complete